MARIRTIKPDYFLDEDLAELSFEARLGFLGLWCEADKAGRLEDKPKRLKATIFPYDNVDMDALLQDLAGGEHPFIQRYQVDGKKYIQILNFTKHQRPHHTERASTIPGPDDSLTVSSPLLDGKYPAGREGKGREGKGKEGKGEGPATAEEILIEIALENRSKFCKLVPGIEDIYQDEANKWIVARSSKMPVDPKLNLLKWMQGAMKGGNNAGVSQGFSGKGSGKSRSVSDGSTSAKCDL